MTKQRAIAALLLIPALLAQSRVPAAQEAPLSQREMSLIARDAYIYAYPLVLMEVTRRQLTNHAEPTGVPGQGPTNVFTHAKEFPTAEFRQVIRANVDALYSSAWVDVAKDNRPVFYDYPTVHRMERVGIRPGASFDLDAQPAQVRQAIERGYRDSKQLIETSGKEGTADKGCAATLRGGAYGTDYMLRAAVARAGLGMNLPEDAIYPALSTDAQGRALTGAHRYVLHFEKDQLPPVDGFWSVTVYDEGGYLVDNPLNRYALGDRDKLVYDDDGSLDIHLQPEPPDKDRQANWLPTPKGKPFNLLLRLYSPRAPILRGAWTPPPVKRVD